MLECWNILNFRQLPGNARIQKWISIFIPVSTFYSDNNMFTWAINCNIDTNNVLLKVNASFFNAT